MKHYIIIYLFLIFNYVLLRKLMLFKVQTQRAALAKNVSGFILLSIFFAKTVFNEESSFINVTLFCIVIFYFGENITRILHNRKV